MANTLHPEALNPEPLIRPLEPEPLGVAIVGCGLIGRKRAFAIPGGRLVVCADLVEARAQALARDAVAKASALRTTSEAKASALRTTSEADASALRTTPEADASALRTTSEAGEHVRSAGASAPASPASPASPPAVQRWQDAVRRDDVDIVIVATTNDALAEVTLAALDAGKHVLVEKPAARRVAEIDPLIARAAGAGRRVRVGFNHRYHPALQKAREIVDSGVIGPLMFVRGRYGHGGRIGYDREWRADADRSGGGELIDQGVHLIDLAGWFLGPFTAVEGFAATYFWDMAVDDNAFMTLRTAAGQCAFLHASCTEWKNMFSLEIYGRTGKIAIDGLGGSYGVERITHYQMRPEMGPPDTTSWEYPRGDRSWALEFGAFVQDIRGGRDPQPGLADARAALAIVDTIYARHQPSGSA